MHEPVAMFRALLDETRMQMLALLRRHGELCVCDLENVLEVTQSKASRHLRYLLNAGLLEDRREAVWIYYRIAANLDPARLAVLDAVSQLLDPQVMAGTRTTPHGMAEAEELRRQSRQSRVHNSSGRGGP